MSKNAFTIAATIGAICFVLIWRSWPTPVPEWTDAEIEILLSLSLDSLPELPPDPSNSVADNPMAAQFGSQLFVDRRLSANGGISCATCHQVERRFTDGLQKGQAIGTTDRHTPSIVGMAYSPWQFWDGRSDSQWSQALAPLVHQDEHAASRSQIAAVISDDENYREIYTSLFGPPNDVNTVFVNVGKSIAAFERTVMPTASRFDEYVEAVATNDTKKQQQLFNDDELRGLRLFIGEANCTQCHNGPLLTNHEFHNTGIISFPGEIPDKSRVQGVREVMNDEFNCLGPYSDDPNHNCPELVFARTGATLVGAFKTPSLRNLENTAPFMHKGQIATLAEVLQHYNIALDAMIGHNEVKPLGLTGRELRQLELFLHTLSAPVSALPDVIAKQ
jgi:cytochrome c peroxidase